MPTSILIFHLPSLIHRLGGERVQKAKLLAAESGCSLKRVRRSRHWQAVGTAAALYQFCQSLKQSEPEVMQYLIKKLDQALLGHQDKLESPQDRLIRIIQANPTITLAQIMELTNCSIAEARRARSSLDFL